MGDVIVVNWMTLDGVMQGPGRPGEDTRGGFAHSGWAEPYTDQVMGAKMGEVMAGGYRWLFGRVAYEGLLASWNEQGGPFKEALNNNPKFVASSDPDVDLPWPNSTVLSGDVTARVADLKASDPTPLIIMGSRVLIEALMTADLIDRYLLFLAPLVLGSGQRLFADGAAATLRLQDSTTTATGAIIASYGPIR